MNYKSLLLSASIFAFLASPVIASKKLTEDLADRESNEQAIIAKLMRSHDYTFSLDVEKEVETIKDMVVAYKKKNEGVGIEPTPQEKSVITFTAKHRILNNLDRARDNSIAFGNGYFTTRNYKGALSTRSGYNPLAYPVFKEMREENDAFLPEGI